MGLIIKDKFNMFITGYPTISDKYNVSGAMLAGSTAAKFGELVKFGSTAGYYEAITSTVTLANIAGFVVATNVKLAENYPGTTVQVNPGEAFNLLIDGAIAVTLDSGATLASATAGADVYVILASGKLTTPDNAAEGTIVALPGCKFTGLSETQGTAKVAEIIVK